MYIINIYNKYILKNMFNKFNIYKFKIITKIIILTNKNRLISI